jgi:hypothetical protein
MKRYIIFCLVILSPLSISENRENHPVIKKLLPELKQWSKNSAVKKAINTQNKKNISLNTIHNIDKKWQEAEGLNDQMLKLLKSPIAQELLQWEIKNGYVFETIIMDNKGAIVAITHKTSDYWQGDEEKFIQAYNNGKGAMHIGNESYDESTNIFLVQVSLPVKRWWKTIGVITFGISIENDNK